MNETLKTLIDISNDKTKEFYTECEKAKDGAIYCSGNCFECADVSAAKVLGYSKERIKQIKNRLKEDL